MTETLDNASWFLNEQSLLSTLRERSDKQGEAERPEIPGYEMLGEIARGGQGVVLMARQQATRRTVAIKVLRDPQFASAQARRRFERETEIVATLDHPGIVRVFDGGVTSTGEPYIVMEHVDGIPFDRYAVAQGRDPRFVAELVATVCDALDAAHRRGVIHRDVKPSNVLVDPAGRARLLDFGLASAAAPAQVGDGPPPQRAMTVTRGGQFIGSLPWASPEQASGDPSRIEVRSDVYAVGVLLYQALTGGFPYAVDGSLATVLHAIESDEPRRPSVARSDLPREFDAILLMALAKRPEDRYSSAAEFAADLRAFVRGEPLKARRESAAAAMTRVVRRYRRVAIASGVVAIAFLALALYAFRLSSEADAQRGRAERRFGQVRQIASTLLFDVHAKISKLDGSREARELIVTSALNYLRDLAPDAEDDAAFMSELATAWERVGDIQGNPLVPNLGQTAPAKESYGAAIALRERVVRQRPDDGLAKVALAGAKGALGFVQLYSGDAEASLATFASGQSTLESVPEEDARTIEFLGTMVMLLDRSADALALVGRTNDAIGVLSKAAEVLGDDSPLATEPGTLAAKRGVIEGKLAATLWEAGRAAEALPHSRTAVAAQRTVAGTEGGSAGRRGLAVELNTLASILIEVGRLDEARGVIDESLAIRRQAIEIDPADAQARADIAYSLIRQAGLLTKLGDAPGVCTSMEEAIGLRRWLSERAPKDGAARRGEAVGHAILAEMCEALAGAESTPADRRPALTARAIEENERAAAMFEAMAEEGLLMPSDADLANHLRSQANRLRSLSLLPVSAFCLGAVELG
ncbi:MAG: serine/threonine protein kinase [Phycisphaerae bacterium]|nr:serine/threonine protein kinase [Phycisphaerae bacterium]